MPPPPPSNLHQRSRSMSGTEVKELDSVLPERNVMVSIKRQCSTVGLSGTLPMWFKLLYGSPRLSMLSLTLLIQVHSVIMYEFAGAPIAYIAFFTALGRSFDTLTDPLMGWITDSTRTKFGRRRPYMMAGCIFYAISFVLFMSPPRMSPIATSLWFGGFYIIFYAFDTLTNVPYVALGPELSDDYDERSSIFFWAKVFDSVGMVVAVVGPSIAELIVGYSWRFTMLAAFLGLYYIVSMMSLSSVVRERDQNSLASQPPFLPSVLKALASKPFRPLLLGWVLDACGLGTTTSMLPFFVTYYIRPPNPGRVLSIAIGSVFISGMISMPVFLWASRRFGRYNAWCMFNLLNGVTCICFVFVGEGDVTTVAIVAALNGIPFGGMFLVDSILTDVIDYDEFLHGTRSEGAFTVFAQIIPKLVSIPAQTLPLALLAIFNFVPSVDGVAQEQPQSVRTFIRVVFIGVPTLCTLVSFLIKLRFPIKTKEMATKISLGIIAHQDGRGFEDPITGQWRMPHQFTPKETADAWVLNSFSTKRLYRLLIDDNTSDLVRCMKRQLILWAIFVVLCSVGLSRSLHLLVNAGKWSWVPSMAILIIGLSFSLTLFAYMRLQAALKIVKDMNPLPMSTIRALTEADFPSVADISSSGTGGDSWPKSDEVSNAGVILVAPNSEVQTTVIGDTNAPKG